ncbi:MAG: glycosyl hydrolase-related protein [Clostridium sp.]|nr:glycosyl hydrolase-related protein [Clostridium sp.]
MDKKKAYVVATAHLDTVWRWDISKTIESYIPDTIGKNFDLIERYPNYKFNFEGAYRYELIEKFYPFAFEDICEYVADDRWCVSGTAYENGDVNIPSPEAIIRNIMLGNNYFQEKFRKSSSDLFLPDCFGFGWALPSIANHCGLKGMTTQKLSWGSAYGLPFDLGRWVGPDGKEIFVSLNAKSYRYKFSGDIRADLSIIDRIADNAKNASLPWANHLYGTGDWGGAPTEESVKAVEASIAKNSDSDFEVISAHSDQVFENLEKLSDNEKKALPVWNTELLMTSHGAGAYTSRCMSKRLNRQCEQLAINTEKACAFAYSLGSMHYPKRMLNEAWKRVIKHQFHDDITGTSTMEVYNDSWNDYYLSLSQFKNELFGASKAIIDELDTAWVPEKSTAVMLSNPTQFDRKSAVEVIIRTTVNCKNVEVVDKEGKSYPCQVTSKSGKMLTVVFQAELAPFSYTIYEIKPADEPCQIKTDLKATNHSLENSKYKLIFNKNGDIAYLYDKRLGKQIIEKPIKMALLHDTGSLAYPSWEIRKEDLDKEPYCYANTPEFAVVENGPARIAIKVTREAEYSTISQIVSLEADGEYINVTNYVDWKTRRTLLKAVFPTSAHNDKASYDLGLGVIERSTNSEKLYEVPAQKWADITDESNEFGVSIFSDCKYGWDKPDDHTLRLSCIHTPAGAFTKDARQDLQDLGRNIFSFAIYSHENGFDNGTQKYSEIYANPICAVQTDDRNTRSLKDRESLVTISNEEVLVRAIKKAEDESVDSIVIRVNEANGKSHKNVSLKYLFEIGAAYEVNGLEEEIKELKAHSHGIVFNIKPFEVKSFKLILKNPVVRIPRERFIADKTENNAKGFSLPNEEMKHVILQGAGFSLPLEHIPEPYLFIGGIRYEIARGANQRYDVMVCRGQEVPIGYKMTRLYFIAGSTLGKQAIKIQVGNKQVPLTIKPISEPISRWDMAGLDQVASVNHNEKLGIEFPYTHHPEGTSTRKANFYIYSVNVRGVRKVILPENNKIVILAMTQVREYAKSAIVSKIEDTTSQDYSFYDDIPPIDKIIDKADFLTIRAGKIQDQVNSGKGKGIKRDNIITNIIRSYTKSEW